MNAAEEQRTLEAIRQRLRSHRVLYEVLKDGQWWVVNQQQWESWSGTRRVIEVDRKGVV